MEDINSKESSAIEYLKLGSEYYYKISNVDSIRPFFMSIVSESNHWLFISSNGGLTAGRKNADFALFPYDTDDKITESFENTGSKTIFIVYKENQEYLWEPFSNRLSRIYKTTRNLYKNQYGNKILFEEINYDLNLTFRYQWNTSNTFGFIRQAKVINHSDDEVKVSLLDGLQNILPAGVNSDLQRASSNLVDAYKRTELVKSVGLGIYALSAIIVDKAEPSEALKANVVWSLGFEKAKYLLSSLQLDKFREGQSIEEETDVKAEKGAYFINSELLLPAETEKEWMIIADVTKSHVDVIALIDKIKNEKDLAQQLNKKIEKGTQRLINLVAASDGIQLTKDKLRDARHFSNTLFNIMRGGIFDNNYHIERWDFIKHIRNSNKEVYNKHQALLNDLPEVFTLFTLKEKIATCKDQDLLRLSIEYLPLKFSRRHGDPSRPWNRFSINTKSEIDGSKILDYEGNWRDIFQNWEALSLSYPEFLEGMIFRFLNATTFDGYNPYRVTKDGFDWETIEPDNPWSYIGYWGDHQIIYLLKFLEILQKHKPGQLENYFNKDLFVYANVPYRIKSYEAILENPKDTIEFDHVSDHKIRKDRESLGADGALLKIADQEIYKVNFVEKILATVLAKLSNFIPEGGIWMNTQRPEWNDANNALVGNGVSMVTLYYLRRFLSFFKDVVGESNLEGVKVSNELVDFYKQVRQTIEDKHHLLIKPINDRDRKLILNGLAKPASEFRQQVYDKGFWGKKRTVSFSGLLRFMTLTLDFLEHSIEANKRSDNMYHAYNLMSVIDDEISIDYLDEMLEGQVAVLSAGYLSAKQSLELLDALKSSKLFRADQYSYLLYPNKKLPGFLEKNSFPKSAIENSGLLMRLLDKGDKQIIERDLKGYLHFNSNFRNAKDLKIALDKLSKSGYGTLVEEESEKIFQLFEKVFNHKAFTGRSGTFYGYEGLGSIYWHMVSKLQLAVQEVCLDAISNNESPKIVGKLLEHYYEINEGIGVHKSPQLHGAFPIDPYSHTPAGKGAQQPGMTGQVKEDILSRFGDLGVFVKEGQLYFDPCILRKEEFITEDKPFDYIDVNNEQKQLRLEENSLCFTYCQVPIVFKLSDKDFLTIVKKDFTYTEFDNLTLDKDISQNIFNRTGEIIQIIVELKPEKLK